MPNNTFNGALSCDVLDHGFVALHNISGPNPVKDVSERFCAHDRDPANCARMSFNAMDTRSLEEDMKLAEYLMKHKHTTPFEMVEIWLEMKLPIFVARQFVRHRTVSINEVSARYVQLPAEWYIPEVVGAKPDKAKQGQTAKLEIAMQDSFRASLDFVCTKSYASYVRYLESGVAPEHARLFLHVNHYTHWMWKQDLHNMMHFLSLRADSHAQVEAQAYALAIIELLKTALPETMKLFDEYRRN